MCGIVTLIFDFSAERYRHFHQAIFITFALNNNTKFIENTSSFVETYVETINIIYRVLSNFKSEVGSKTIHLQITISYRICKTKYKEIS